MSVDRICGEFKSRAQEVREGMKAKVGKVGERKVGMSRALFRFLKRN